MSAAHEIVAVDIGGMHARFAIATIEHDRVISLERQSTLRTAEHASLRTAWEAYAAGLGRPLPREARIAVACPIQGDLLKLTNNLWIIRPDHLSNSLGLGHFSLVNDFVAVGHAVAQVGPEHMRHLCGPDEPVGDDGVVTIVGPGTGLGVAMLLQRGDHADVIETEGGHVDFASPGHD